VVNVLDRPDLVTDPSSPTGKNRTANKESCAPSSPVLCQRQPRALDGEDEEGQHTGGYLRTVEEGFNAPEVRDRHRLSRIPHPTAAPSPY